MGRKSILMLAVGECVGALAGGAIAGILGESSHGEQVLLASVTQEYVPEGNWAGTDWQVGYLAENDAIPVTVSEDSWRRETVTTKRT